MQLTGQRSASPYTKTAQSTQTIAFGPEPSNREFFVQAMVVTANITARPMSRLPLAAAASLPANHRADLLAHACRSLFD